MDEGTTARRSTEDPTIPRRNIEGPATPQRGSDKPAMPQGERDPALPGLDEVLAARERIHPHVRRTPLLSARFLGDRHGARVHLKAENLQRGGAFKIRGALNAMLQARFRGEIGPAGVLTYSSGNHGQAVALAARLLECTATVVAPEDLSPIKRAAMEGYGARVLTAGLTTEDRRRAGERLARESGALVVPPYDHPDIIAGQGTIALEILEEMRAVDAILVPVGGGGLISGIAIALKALRPHVRVIGVEPETADDFRQSLAAGQRVTIAPPRTIADGLRAITPGELTFVAAQRFVDAIWTVSDDAIRDAQREVLERGKLLVEPSGAAAVAAFLQHGDRLRGAALVLVLSGGNAAIRTEGILP